MRILVIPDTEFEIGQLAWALKIDTLMQTLASQLSYRVLTIYHTQVSHLINFTVRDFFLASALKRSCHPPENMLKFNVSGGDCHSLEHFLRTWPPDTRSKNYLTLLSPSEPLV